MFERFTKQLRHTVVEAQECARGDEAREIETAHLLFALLTHAEQDVAEYLCDHLPDYGQLRAEFEQARRRGDVTDADAEALAELGIDVDRIVDAVERSHGENALAPGRGRARKSVRKRGPRGHIPFSTDAKHTLEQSLREALALGDTYIGGEHLLLALLGRRGIVADVLRSHGITEHGLREARAHRRAG